ncbi:unnamed protein product, partial [Amoebophrya sp. A120]
CDSSEPDAPFQDIFRALGLRRILINWLLEQQQAVVNTSGTFPTTAVLAANSITTLACQLLAQSVRKHTANQLELFEFLDELTSQIAVPDSCSVEFVLEQMFSNNEQIASQLATSGAKTFESLMSPLLELSCKKRRNFIGLKVLQNMVVVHDAPLPLAKRVLLDLLRAEIPPTSSTSG